jgi:hypothetical protein
MTCVVHIGLPKSGTTTIQNALHNSRRELSELGVFYPAHEHQVNHSLPAVDLMRDDALAHSRQTPHRRRHLAELEPQLKSAWRHLIAQVPRDFPRVVISAENLVYCGEESIAKIRDDWGERSISVVASVRPPSLMLSSYFSQSCKVEGLPDFEQYVRTSLRDLLAGDTSSPIKWLDVHDLRAQWESGLAADFHVTRIGANADDKGMRELWEQLVGTGLPFREVANMNIRSPLAVTEASRLFLREHSEAGPAVMRALFQRAATRARRVPPVRASYLLQPRVGSLLQDFLAYEQGPSAQSRKAGDELGVLITAGGPITKLEVSAPHTPEDLRLEVEQLHANFEAWYSGTRRAERVRRRIGNLKRSLKRAVPRL